MSRLAIATSGSISGSQKARLTCPVTTGGALNAATGATVSVELNHDDLGNGLHIFGGTSLATMPVSHDNCTLYLPVSGGPFVFGYK